MTNQPDWKCIGQLGDENPLDYGGYWVLEDTTGVYPEEAEYLETNEEDGLTAWRFILEKCTYENGVLSDNPFHKDYPAWFADDLDDVASCCGTTADELRRKLCSDNALERAEAYRDIGNYFGMENLDQYPLHLSRREAKLRYAKKQYRDT